MQKLLSTMENCVSSLIIFKVYKFCSLSFCPYLHLYLNNGDRDRYINKVKFKKIPNSVSVHFDKK